MQVLNWPLLLSRSPDLNDEGIVTMCRFAKDHNLQGPIQKEFFRVKA